MKITGVVENGLIRPLDPVELPSGVTVQIIVPEREVEISDEEIARRREIGERLLSRREKLDIRPLTAVDLIRGDRAREAPSVAPQRLRR